ncbi:lipoyl domain-containing protein [bacterium]|nr:lipoyl domain-containing protein [bacterium]|tara:strand:+ start:202 stop:444 length:243 start_codon:yes stop_codon:yes gene_type:complete
MKIELKLPRISMNMEEGTIVKWLVGPDESFTEGETLYEVETEKVTSEFEAPCSGKMIEHFVVEGENAMVGDKVCKIEKID